MPRGVYKRKPITETARKILSDSHKGLPSPMGMLGKKHSEATKKNMVKSHMGQPATIGMTGKNHKEETRRKISNTHLKNREKHPNWKGGNRREIHKIIRQSLEYRLWRESVFKRDDWTCVWCKIKGKRLNADHIKPFSLFPELRFAIDNGRTLCEECHKTTETYGKHY